MAQIQEMLKTHPQQNTGVSVDALASTIESLNRCVAICTSCADACLGESEVSSLKHCIRTDLDCADICRSTVAVLSRQTEPDWRIIGAQLQACVAACQACGDECRKHAEHHDHCRVCADACDECEDACQRLLDSLPQS